MIMSRPRIVSLALMVSVFALAAPQTVRAADFLVFPAKVSLGIRSIIIGFEVDQLVKTTLKEKDIVNLALGRPLGSKVDKNTEVLAVALTTEGPSNAPLARLIVFDPSQTGIAAVKAVVAKTTTLDFDFAPGGKGQGTVTAVVQETTLGTPAQNALHPSTVLATGVGTVGPLVVPGLVKLKAVVNGRLSFNGIVKGQPTAVSGIIVTGKAAVSGKLLGSFSQ
jgi:hypothetical protein